MQDAITFGDVLLEPRYSAVLPSQVHTNSRFSRNIPLNIPIISSPMDTVTEHRMAIAIALEGGIGIIHKNLTPEEQAEEVRLVKRYENGFITDPVAVNPKTSVSEIYQIFLDKGYKKIPVIDSGGLLLGLITEVDYFWPHDRDKLAREVMRPVKDLKTASDKISLTRANEIIREQKLAILCMVNRAGKLKAIVTRRDLEKNKDYPNSNKDAHKITSWLAEKRY